MSQLYQPKQYDNTELLEEYLGSPLNPDNEFSFQHSLELDEQELYPEEVGKILEKWDFHHYYIPTVYGGKLKSYEEMLSLLRAISRRDLTVAIGHGKTYLGSVSIWVGDDEPKKYQLAEIIKEQKQVALGLTEKAHGSDLVANEFTAVEVEDGFLLTGEKWLINNATRSKALTIFARINNDPSPRSFSIFLIQKDTLDKSSYRHLDKIKTHGIRGADISGISFNQCLVPKESLIGKSGYGLENTLKGFQITRTICAGLSLGAADTALRTTLDFALSRQLYGDSVFAIPYTKKVLVDAFLDILICDCVAIGSARAIHVTPEQMSIWSAITKYFVPTTIEKVINNLSVVLGARYYLRESHWGGVFQKVVRDHAIVSLFDGSTLVNLYAIALYIRHLAKFHKKTNRAKHEESIPYLKNTFCLETKLPNVHLNKLEIFSQGRNDILQGLQFILKDLEALQEVNPQVLDKISQFTNLIFDLLEKQNQILKDLSATKGYKESPVIYDIARQYNTLYAAAACLYMWLYNRKLLGNFFAQGEWLILCLDRLITPLVHLQHSLPDYYRENTTQELLKLYQQNKLFSIIPIQLART
ncbi:acyl-CoA dehydrogenase [Nostoc sp.]|uniref:acyl-CoA dehydrogenase n=1 Tax=Nostoc sp. TaxID=1180 RepID=UPI002FF48F91